MLNVEERDKLVESNLNLIYTGIRKVFKAYKVNLGVMDEDDFYQIGAIGLIKAAKYFKPELGNQFSTYAVPMITGEIMRELRDRGTAIKFTRGIIDLGNKIKRENLHFNTIKEIMDYFNIDKNLASGLLDYLNYARVSMESPIKSNNVEKLTIKDTLEVESFENELLKGMELQYYLDNIPELNRKVIELSLKGITQINIAEELGISQVHVSRLIRKSIILIEKLKKGEIVSSKKDLFVKMVNSNKSKTYIMEKLEITTSGYSHYYKNYIEDVG